jgi:LysM repeat protein
MVVRYAAPVAFLVAVTIAVLLVRSGLSESNDGGSPPASVTDTSATTTATLPRTTTTKTSAGARFYEIQAGDTLETVAAEFDTTVEQLLILNPDVDPVALGIGERIRVK